MNSGGFSETVIEKSLSKKFRPQTAKPTGCRQGSLSGTDIMQKQKSNDMILS